MSLVGILYLICCFVNAGVFVSGGDNDISFILTCVCVCVCARVISELVTNFTRKQIKSSKLS